MVVRRFLLGWVFWVSVVHADDCSDLIGRKDFSAARTQCLQQADQGDAGAAYQLAVLYAQGQGGSIDLPVSVSWLKRAARSGNIEAMYNLAVAYFQGKGTAVDRAQALYWYERAASARHPGAMRDLAAIYAEGQGVKPDLERAYGLYLASAQLGEPVSQLQAGLMLLQGRGVTANPRQALVWLSQAAEHGLPAAQFTLANQIADSEPESAFRWYSQAANSGFGYAMHNLAYSYFIGQGTVIDFDQAEYWARQGVLKGVKESVALLDEIDQARRTLAGAEVMPVPVVDERWLGSHPDSAQLVQLSRHRSREAAHRFQMLYMPDTRNTVIYTDVSNVSAPFVVLLGPYQDATVAREAIAGLGEALRAEKPWVRSVASFKMEGGSYSLAEPVESEGGVLNSPGLKPATWLSGRHPQRVVIQLMAVPVDEEARMTRFVRENGLQATTLSYRTFREAGEYQVLLYAREFERVADAQRALKMLPYAVQHAKPWIRQYSALQKRLRTTPDRE
jgi:TPR repeat protein